MSNEEEIYNDDYKFETEKNNVIRDGKSATVFVTGSIISELLEAQNLLLQDNIELRIINIHTIKPFDTDNIIKECSKQSIIFSLEEHSIIGGIGSSIADVIATSNINSKLIKIGLNDKFAEGYRTYKQIKEINNLDAKSIYKVIKENLH